LRFADGERLFIAADASALLTLKSLIARSFLAVFGTILALGLLISLLAARSTLKRVDQFASTLHEIMAGDLSRRISLSRTGDEFDRLATEMNQMLQRIQELMKNLRQVTNDISHDLRSPLARLRTHLELSRARFTDQAMHEMCDESISQLDQALDIFAAMLRLAEVEAGARRAHFTTVDLSALLTMLVESYEPVLAEHGIILQTEIAPKLWIQGDRDMLAQLFANLLDNIMLHAQGASRAEIQAEQENGWVKLSFGDDGSGIPAEARSIVLQRFVRLDTARQRPGHGLGLPLAQAITVLHGGHLDLTGDAAGLVVRISLPAACQ
jgi:signal transduction histidine kinase